MLDSTLLITFTSLGKFGRLGNQMYQYAALFSLGQTRALEIKIPDLRRARWHGQRSLLQNFNLSASILNRKDRKRVSFYYSEPDWRFDDPNFFNIEDNTDIRGYFPSLFYFEKHALEVREEFTPNSIYSAHAQKVLGQVRELSMDSPLVAIHLRLGDAVDERITGRDASSRLAYYQSSEYSAYISNALSMVPSSSQALVLTGGSRSSRVDYRSRALASSIFKSLDYVMLSPQSAFTDFLLLTLVDHVILSHASSFGWWGAYLNHNPYKVVVAPENYLSPTNKFKRANYYPSDWIVL